MAPMGPMCYAAEQRALFVAPSLLKMKESNHELPGVKGQWIKVSDCPPLETRTCERRKELKGAESTEYWRPTFYDDNRPFTLPAKPKLVAGQVWRRRDNKIITIKTYDEYIDRFRCSENYVYRVDGKAYLDFQTGTHIQDVELVELISDAPREPVGDQSDSSKSIERKIEELRASDSGIVFAKGDDETLWYLCERPDPAEATTEIFWVQIPPLPTREA